MYFYYVYSSFTLSAGIILFRRCMLAAQSESQDGASPSATESLCQTIVYSPSLMMNIPQTIEAISAGLVDLDRNSIISVVKSLDTLLKKTKEILETLDDPVTNPQLEYLTELHTDVLKSDDLPPLKDYLKGLEFHRQGNDRPKIHLFGDTKYVYSKLTENVVPTPLDTSPLISYLLDEVNKKLECEFNSILVNRYDNLNVYLPFHKDDEDVLDKAYPIATFSLGATRRLQVSNNSDKETAVEDIKLSPNSLLVMLPGFQDFFYHQLAPGKRDSTKERGMRYSFTFRRISPSIEAPAPSPPSQLPATTLLPGSAATEHMSSNNTKPPAEKLDVAIFGSSLVKGLDATRMSSHGKTFKVFKHSGAHIKDIKKDIENTRNSDVVDCSSVSTVFLVCGGNDLDSLPENKDLTQITEDYKELFNFASKVFPNAELKIVSLIPRRTSYQKHITRMHAVNIWLRIYCNENCHRYVDIFSFFVLNSNGHLNMKLFNGSKIHFTAVGDSVLAKVITAVSYKPYRA